MAAQITTCPLLLTCRRAEQLGCSLCLVKPTTKNIKLLEERSDSSNWDCFVLTSLWHQLHSVTDKLFNRWRRPAPLIISGETADLTLILLISILRL